MTARCAGRVYCVVLAYILAEHLKFAKGANEWEIWLLKYK